MTNNPTIDGVPREFLLNKCSCGSTDLSFCYESPQGHWISCDECGEESPSFENKGSALDHWNKRALLDAPVVKPASDLREHCKQCAEVVKTWPEWKQGCLGGAPVVERQPVVIAEIVDYIVQSPHPRLWYGPELGAMPVGTKLYTAPPASVAVVLPERMPEYDAKKHPAYAIGWNACLDATAALNQGAK